MGAGRKCKVHYGEKTVVYNSMDKTALNVLRTICKNHSYSYKEIKDKLPDEVANHGPKFMKHPAVFKKETDLEASEKFPKPRFFHNEPIYLEKDKCNIVVSNQWNKDNFAEFSRAVYEEFDIKIDF